MQAAVDGTPYTQQYPIDAATPSTTKEIDASALWKKIVHNAWKSAEPVFCSGIPSYANPYPTVMQI